MRYREDVDVLCASLYIEGVGGRGSGGGGGRVFNTAALVVMGGCLTQLLLQVVSPTTTPASCQPPSHAIPAPPYNYTSLKIAKYVQDIPTSDASLNITVLTVAYHSISKEPA